MGCGDIICLFYGLVLDDAVCLLTLRQVIQMNKNNVEKLFLSEIEKFRKL